MSKRPILIGNQYYLDWSIRLGAGSFATVYRGVDKNTNAPVAIKVIDLSKASQRERSYLQREINTMKKLNHPNLVRLHHVSEDPSQMYFVMEYCGGGELRAFITKHGRLSEAIARHFLCQIASGLRHLHEKKIVHRDLKPHNILLSEDSDDAEVKIADFGFAREIDPTHLMDSYLGSPLYMAPEILLKKRYSNKTDLWSIGVIFYEMLTGKPIFYDEVKTKEELIAKVTGSDIFYPPYISQGAVKLLKGLLTRDSNTRLTWDGFFDHEYLRPQPTLLVPLKAALSSSLRAESSVIPVVPTVVAPQQPRVQQPQQPVSPVAGPPRLAPPQPQNEALVGSTTWMQPILYFYPHGQEIVLYIYPDKLVGELKNDLSRILSINREELLLLKNSGKELQDYLPIKEYKFDQKRKPMYLILRSMLEAVPHPIEQYKFDIDQVDEPNYTNSVNMVTHALNPMEKLKATMSLYDQKLQFLKVLYQSTKQRALQINNCRKQQDIQSKIYKVIRTFGILQSGILSEVAQPIDKFFAEEEPEVKKTLSMVADVKKKLSAIKLDAAMTKNHPEWKTLLDVIGQEHFNNLVSQCNQMYDTAKARLKILTRVKELSDKIEEIMRARLDGNSVRVIIQAKEGSLTSALEVRENLRSMTQVFKELVDKYRKSQLSLDDPSVQQKLQKIDEVYQQSLKKFNEVNNSMAPCALAKLNDAQSMSDVIARLGGALKEIRELTNEIRATQDLLVGLDVQLRQVQEYQTLPDRFLEFASEAARRKAFATKWAEQTNNISAQLSKGLENETIKRKGFRQSRAHMSPTFMAVLANLLPPLADNQTDDLVNFNVNWPVFDAELPLISDSREGFDDEFSIIVDTSDVTKKVTDLERENTKLIGDLKRITEELMRREFPSEVVPNNNARDALKRVNELEEQLKRTQTSFEVLGQEMELARMQVRDLNNEKAFKDKQLQDLATERRTLLDQVTRVVGPNQSDLIEQLLVEQMRSQKEKEDLENRVKLLQAQLANVRL
jgi:serine/threonine protein kinase